MECARESIIVAAVRTFCKSFAGILGLLIGALLVFISLMLFSSPDIYPPKSALTLSADAKGNRDLLPLSAPVILQMNITGVIGQGDLTYEKFQDLLYDSQSGMLANARVKALLLHINTPGGAADDSDSIYRALMDYKTKYQVPIYAYVDGMCCSGGMYIASAADKIFASPSSVIGSVGVIVGPSFNFSGLMQMYGVQSVTLTQGKDKDMLNPFRPWVPGEDASLRALTAALYDRFVSIVVAARPHLSKEKLVNEYGAQVYIAKQAEALGYIDVADVNYNAALTELASQAKLPEGQSYQVISIQPAHTFFSDLAYSKWNLLSGNVTHQFQLSPSMPSEFSGRLLYLYQPAY